MKDIQIRKTLIFSIVLLLVGAVFVPYISGERFIRKTEQVAINVNQYDDTIEISYDIDDFDDIPVIINDIEYLKIIIGEESNLLFKGKPDIPNICRSILIPDTAKMEIDVIDSSFLEYKNVLIAPSKGNLLRSVNPEEIPYEFGEVYNEDAWFPGDIAKLRDPYILRDYRSQVVEIYPIQYNPAKKLMRFYTNIVVNVYENGVDNINIINREKLPESVDSDFKLIYKNHFINFGKSDRYDPVSEQGNMLIITYDNFWDTMIPFVQWKKMQGIPTEMVNVSTIGDANAIKTYVEDYYNSTGLTFLLLVGDAAQVPPYYAGSSASDPSYTYIVGSDHYPDLFVGRFSAQNNQQLETQVERSIEYEKYPQSGAEWYKKGVGVASSQGLGDDGEMDYEHIRNIRDKLMDYTYIEVDELYDGSQGGEDESGNPTSIMVSEAVNDGRSVLNYCGHGSPSGWGSSGFGNDNIHQLVNDNMLPYVINVACNNGQFNDYDECFCEAWLRATHDGEPTGAIAATGSSKSMTWDPPMDAQDEMADLLVESYTNNVKHTIGGIHANGCMHMNDEYGEVGYSETDTWHVFGDPSLQIRTNTPSDITVDHDEQILLGSKTFELDVSGAENALCAISYETKLLGYSYTDEKGHANITFNETIEFLDELDLVVTAYNKNPYITKLQIYLPPPDLKIGIVKGGLFYIKATIKNDGDAEATDINWEISIEGGIIPFGRICNGTITNIAAEGEMTITSKLILGFGQVRVKVTASGSECNTYCNRGGKVFLFFIHVNPGGS